MASRIITIDDQLLYSDQESTSSSTPPPDDNNNNNNFNHKRRSWLSHLSSSVETTATTTPCSHRSSFSSTFSGSTLQSQHQPSPKPHKSNQPLWESIRRLRHEINSSRGGGGRHNHEVGLEHFRLIKRVGSGDLGSVYLCQIRGGLSNSNSLYAMKVVDREALASRNKLGRAEIEREILCMLDHPFLPTLYAEFDASHYSCLVMEFCPGGDLYSARLKQPLKRFTVSSTKFYAAEVLLALEYLHMMGIIYRDLKPENVLVREDGHIMLSDFDLCLKCNDVVPKLLLHKQQTYNNNYPRFTTTSSSVSSSPPPQPNNVTAAPSCAGPLRPVLTSCFSLRRRRQGSTTTTITEYATSRHNDDNLSSVTDKHYSKSNKHRSTEWESESESEYYNYSSDVQRHSSVMYQRWATEMVAEPIEARSKSFVGTHEYLAPEVISGQGHGSAVDWWTFGVFLYEMIFGVTPFKGENNEKTLRNILKQPLTFPPSSTYQYRHGEVLEMEIVKDLIRKLLMKNPKRRIGSLKGSVEIKKHEFFRGVNWALIRSVRPPVVPSEEMRRRGGSGSSKNVENNQVMKKMMMNDRDRKIAVMMMMKKKSTTTTNSTPRGLTSFMLPKVLSRKERDQPYQIPFHYDYYRSRHQHGQVNDQQQQYQRHLRRRDEQQPHNQHFEYF